MAITDGRQQTIRLFYCYSHADESLRDALAAHLSVLRRNGLITEWHDRRIMPGATLSGSIGTSLDEADLILLLVSADFLNSDYCWDVEMQRALERHELGLVIVVPVILRTVDWSETPFKDLLALPLDGRPVSSWADRDEAFADVAMSLRRLITDLRDRQMSPNSTPSTMITSEVWEADEDGLLDLQEISEGAFHRLSDVTTQISEIIKELGNLTSASISQLPNGDDRGIRAAARPILNDVAEHISGFAVKMTGLVGLYEIARSEGFSAVSRSCELAPDFQESGIAALRASDGQLEELGRVIPITRDQMASMRQSLAKVPRLTTRLNRAKRLAVKSMDELQQQLDLTASDATSIRMRIREIVASMTS